MSSLGDILKLYPLSNYKIKNKGSVPRKDFSKKENLIRLQREYEMNGPRKTVEAVILVHEHKVPHLLLLQVTRTLFLLPGGEMDVGEDEIDCLRRYLVQYLSPNCTDTSAIQWEIVESDIISNWWRPNFESMKYPYIPSHITKPKEHLRQYLVRLPETATFSVPLNYALVAVPLLELYDNKQSYGHVIASLPQVLSRFNFHIL